MRSLVGFLNEFFSPDHGANKMSVVILNPHDPSKVLVELLSSQFFVEKVHYIKGSPNSSLDLAKAKDTTAHGIFMLSAEGGIHALTARNDMVTTLAVRSVKLSTPWTPIYCQVSIGT